MARTRTKKIKTSSNNILDKTDVSVRLEFTNYDLEELQMILDRRGMTLEKFIEKAVADYKSMMMVQLRLSGAID